MNCLDFLVTFCAKTKVTASPASVPLVITKVFGCFKLLHICYERTPVASLPIILGLPRCRSQRQSNMQ